LTRAALRSAWAADPAIRDFIGIAESQWDFNDPAAIPGFGPLGAADYARDLVARALASPENPASANADSQYSASADEVLQVAAAPADSSPTEVHSVTPGNAPEASADSPARHPHGGALPK
jgi:hypothetical protein